jgi:hypothetical protein
VISNAEALSVAAVTPSLSTDQVQGSGFRVCVLGFPSHSTDRVLYSQKSFSHGALVQGTDF